MNSIQLKIRIDAIESNYTKDETLVVNGTCSFKFYDNKSNQVRPLAFTAYGKTAASLKQSGVDSVQVISGRLNVYKPTDEKPNHRCLLTIERAICVKPETTPVVEQKAQPQSNQVATANHTPVASTNGNVYNEDEIPF